MAYYKYGTYGYLDQSITRSAVQAGTMVVYVGTAPVNLVRGYAGAGIIHLPVKLFNDADAQQKIGASNDWVSFSLCEAVAAHFDNAMGNIGPIVVINVLNPDVHRASAATETNLSFTNGRASFRSDRVILDTLALTDKVEGVDYAVDYDYGRGSVIVQSLNMAEPITGIVTASYYEVDPSAITAEDIIGGVTANGVYTGLGALQLVYPNLNEIPNLLAAPGWSHNPDVYRAMVNAAQQINGHWNAFVLADIPLVDAASAAVDTMVKATAWKASNGYTSEFSMVCWPMVADVSGRLFHLSSLAAATMQRVDLSHDGIPMETPGNKTIPAVRHFFGADSPNQGYDKQAASNNLASAGITTAVAWAGAWVLWGDHTAAYQYGAEIDPRAIFDVSIRMLLHVTNSFQREWAPQIDAPMTRQLIDRILNREQEKLDALAAMGALLGEPRIQFIESVNPTEEMMNGHFRWDIQVTPTPPLKSATVYVAYTDEGFSAYFEEGGEE